MGGDETCWGVLFGLVNGWEWGVCTMGRCMKGGEYHVAFWVVAL